MLEPASSRGPRRYSRARALGLALLPLLGLGWLVAIPETPRDKALAPAHALPPQRVAIVALGANRRENRHDAEERALWLEAARAVRLVAEQIEAESLAELELTRFGLWLLPRQEELSYDDVAALDAFLGAGGGVVLSGASGTRDPEPEASSLPLERFFPGVRFERVARSESDLEVSWQGPLVVGLTPGQRLQIEPARDAWIARGEAVLRWQPSGGAALLYGRYRGSPIAWLGLEPEALQDVAVAQTLLRNALAYASRRPAAEIQPWPFGHPTAALIVADLDPSQQPDPDVAERNLAQVERIHRSRGAPFTRAEDLRECSTPVGADVDDERTLAALVARGCSFATLPGSSAATPRIADTSAAPLVLLPAALRDLPPEPQDPRALLRRELGEFERIRRLGGVYAMSYHDAWLARSDGEILIDRLLGELAERDVWFTDGEQLSAWWLSRREIHAELAVEQPGIARLRVRNDGRAPARGVTARVYLPPDAMSPLPATPRIFGRSETIRVASDRSWMEFVTPLLDPGQEVLYTLSF